MKRFLALSMILGLAMIAAGCGTTGDDPAAPYSSDDPSLQVVDLDSPTGGFTETDEEPMFGEPGTFLSLEEGEGEECEYQDTLRERERIQEMERMSGARIYRLRAIWGRMAAAVDDSAVTECCPVDWSGGMKLEGGVIIIERVLKFDPDNERALELKRWARIEPWPEFVEEAPGPADFPAVVREARMAAIEARDVIHWWIDERQDETGYMVGRADMWNDDTKLFNEYGWLWLLSGDEKLAREALRKKESILEMERRYREQLDEHRLNAMKLKDDLKRLEARAKVLEFAPSTVSLDVPPAFKEYDRLVSRIEELEAQVEAMMEVKGG